MLIPNWACLRGPVTTAAATTDSGSSTTSSTRPVAPPITSGLKRRSASDAFETQNRAPETDG